MTKERADYAVFQMYVEHCPDDGAFISIMVGDLKQLVAEVEEVEGEKADNRLRAIIAALQAIKNKCAGSRSNFAREVEEIAKGALRAADKVRNS